MTTCTRAALELELMLRNALGAKPEDVDPLNGDARTGLSVQFGAAGRWLSVGRSARRSARWCVGLSVWGSVRWCVGSEPGGWWFLPAADDPVHSSGGGVGDLPSVLACWVWCEGAAHLVELVMVFWAQQREVGEPTVAGEVPFGQVVGVAA